MGFPSRFLLVFAVFVLGVACHPPEGPGSDAGYDAGADRADASVGVETDSGVTLRPEMRSSSTPAR